MPEATGVQNSFTAGELSPRLYGRNDLAKYRNGLAEQLNYLTQKHGGAIRRSGTRFVAQAKDSEALLDRGARLIRFQFSTQQSYVLEFGHQYVRFFRDRGRLQHGDIFTVTGAVNAAGISTITVGFHGMQVGQSVSVQGILTNDVTFPRGYNGTFTLTGITATTVSYAQAVAPPGAYTSGGTVTPVAGLLPTEKSTPYTEADLPLLKVTQSADVLYIVHPLYEPRTLRRATGADSDPAVWTLAALDGRDGPYLPVNSDAAATLTTPAGAAGATVNFTVSNAAVALINGGQGFISTDVGRLLRWKDSAGPSWRWAEITVVNARNSIDVLLKIASIVDVVIDWRLGAWSDSTGWPFCTVFHEDRLWFGGSNSQLQTLWSSVVGDYTLYQPSARADGVVGDTDAIVVTINDDQINTIHWLKSDSRGLIVLTDGGVFLAESTEENTITALNIHVIRHVQESAAQRPPPRQISGVTLMVMSADRKVREFVFRVDQERFAAPDLTILSEHVTLGGLIDTGLQMEPDIILWTLRGDGVIAAMTYEREEDVTAFSRHVIAGTLAAVESIEVVRDGVDDLVWMIVRRLIGARVTRYVEFIEALFADQATVEEAFFVDSGLTHDQGVAITGISQAMPAIVSAPAHGLMAGDRVRIRAVQGMTEVNDRSWLVPKVNPDDFELYGLDGEPVDSTAFATYVSGGQVYREVQSVTGLEHLAGQTVKILADGQKHPDAVVSGGGAVALARYASIIHVGLGYMSRLKSLPLVPLAAIDARGRPARVDHAVVRFNRSLGGVMGSFHLDEIVHRTPPDLMNQPTPLFSGQQRLSVSQRHELDGTITIQTDDPLPMNVLGWVLEAGVEAV
jgi:hypothetical protein